MNENSDLQTVFFEKIYGGEVLEGPDDRRNPGGDHEGAEVHLGRSRGEGDDRPYDADIFPNDNAEYPVLVEKRVHFFEHFFSFFPMSCDNDVSSFPQVVARDIREERADRHADHVTWNQILLECECGTSIQNNHPRHDVAENGETLGEGDHQYGNGKSQPHVLERADVGQENIIEVVEGGDEMWHVEIYDASGDEVRERAWAERFSHARCVL